MIVNCRRNSGERGNVLAEETREMGKKTQMIFNCMGCSVRNNTTHFDYVVRNNKICSQ
jgi:hypothetical protein